MSLKNFRTYTLTLPVFPLLVLTACSGQEAPAPSAPPPGAVRVDESKAGTLTGRVLFEGTPPPNPSVSVGADPVCARANADGLTYETVLVNNGQLHLNKNSGNISSILLHSMVNGSRGLAC